MIHAIVIGMAIVLSGAGAEPVACELVDEAAAEAILGANPVNMSDAETPSICMYMKADGTATLMAHVLGHEMYDATPIHPRTSVEIGDRGRFNEDESGTAIVQFVKGEYSMRISVSARSIPDASYLPALMDAARSAAAGIPG